MLEAHDNAFFDEHLGVYIQCNSPSDALLAPLVLKNGVDFDLLNDVLSIIHDPSFDLKEVTFKNTGDVLVHIARIRETHVSSLVDAKPSSPSMLAHSPKIPPIVVEYTLSVIRDEMLQTVSELLMRDGGDLMETTEKKTLLLATLLNCSLVHSSWLPPARRAAGVFLQKYRQPIIQFIRNPCFGQWTRELHLQFNLSLPCSAHLAALFVRTPNVTFLSLDISSRRISHFLKKTDALMVSTRISHHLRYLEELSLSFGLPDPEGQRPIVSSFLSFPSGIPSLNVLRLFGVGMALTIAPPFLYELSRVAPNLKQIHVQMPLAPGDQSFPRWRTGPISLSWMKDTDAGRPDFLPGRLHYCIISEQGSSSVSEPSEADRSFLSAVKNVRLDCYDSEDSQQQRSQDISSLLRTCTSTETLELSLPCPNFQLAYNYPPSHILTSLPRSVQILHIHIRYPWTSHFAGHEDQIDQTDEMLAGALNSLRVHDHRLREVNVHASGNLSSGAMLGAEPGIMEMFGFRRINAWCTRNSISFAKTAKFSVRDLPDYFPRFSTLVRR